MMDYKIYIPSFGRAGEVTTTGIIPSATIVVPNSQFDDYAEHHRLVMGIPDERDGRIAKKRNAIIDLTPEKNIVMMDDDLIKIFWIANKKNILGNEFLDIIDLGFELCREYGTALFGFNWNSNPTHLQNAKPITTNKSFYNTYGIIKSGLRFDEKLTRIEDLDFWVQNTMKFRKTIRFNYIKTEYKIKSPSQAGGIKEQVEDKVETDYLRKKWPPGVVLLDSQYQTKIPKSPYKDLI